MPELMVITHGTLKGFVSVHPGWAAVDHKVLFNTSLSAYSEEERESLLEEISFENNKGINGQYYSGYCSAREKDCLNTYTPSITVSRDRIQWSRPCIKKMDSCRYVELLYHPILKMLILRKANEDNPNSIRWISDKGNQIINVKSARLSESIFSNLNWNLSLKYQVRGIVRQRGNGKIIFFYLDDPKVSDERDYISDLNNRLRQKRKSLMSLMTESDILASGVIVKNPLIGDIPAKEEIWQELEELFRSM